MSTAVAERIETAPVEVPVKDQELSMIERLAAMPSVNMDVIDRLFALREKREKEAARKDMLTDFAAFQQAAKLVEKGGTGNNKTKYARLEDFVGGVLPVLTQHGFSLRHEIAQTEGKVTVTAILGHRSGHIETASITLPADTTGNKNPVQSYASTLTYGRRYTGMAVLGMAAEGEDDDAKAAGNKKADASPVITEGECRALKALLKEANLEEQIIFESFNVEALSELTKAQGDEITAKVNKKLKKS